MAKEVKKEKNENKNFFKEFKAELKRVNWPTFKQLVNNTTAVLTIVLITAAIVFVLDVIFENLNNYGVEKLKAAVTSISEEASDEEAAQEDEIIDSEEVQNDETEDVTDDSNTDENVDITEP